MTWHQWHELYPTETRSGLSLACASANASSPHSLPVDGVLGVLEQVRARGAGEAVHTLNGTSRFDSVRLKS